MEISHAVALANNIVDYPYGYPDDVISSAESVVIAMQRLHMSSTEFRSRLVVGSVHTFLNNLCHFYQSQVAALHNEKSSLVTALHLRYSRVNEAGGVQIDG